MAYNKAKHPWALALSQAITAWCKQNGYREKNVLGKELGIDDKKWGRISSGETFSEIENYALIYWRTRLEEANPTKVAPLTHYVPKTKEYNSVERAWTQHKLDVWMAEQNEKHLGVKPAQIEVPIVHAPTKPDDNGALHQLLEAVIAEVSQRTAQSVVKEIRASMSENRLPDNTDVTSVAEQLTDLLQTYVDGDESIRDKLISQHGNALGKLSTLLNPLIMDPKQREKSLKMKRELAQ